MQNTKQSNSGIQLLLNIIKNYNKRICKLRFAGMLQGGEC